MSVEITLSLSQRGLKGMSYNFFVFMNLTTDETKKECITNITKITSKKIILRDREILQKALTMI